MKIERGSLGFSRGLSAAAEGLVPPVLLRHAGWGGAQCLSVPRSPRLPSAPPADLPSPLSARARAVSGPVSLFLPGRHRPAVGAAPSGALRRRERVRSVRTSDRGAMADGKYFSTTKKGEAVLGARRSRRKRGYATRRRAAAAVAPVAACLLPCSLRPAALECSEAGCSGKLHSSRSACSQRPQDSRRQLHASRLSPASLSSAHHNHLTHAPTYL